MLSFQRETETPRGRVAGCSQAGLLPLALLYRLVLPLPQAGENDHRDAGVCGGQHLPSPQSQHPLADLATSLGWAREGEGGCSLGPRRRRQEPFVSAALLRHLFSLLPAVASPLPLGSLCAALFILRPWQSGPACSQREAPAALPAPAQSWQLRAAGQAQSPCC